MSAYKYIQRGTQHLHRLRGGVDTLYRLRRGDKEAFRMLNYLSIHKANQEQIDNYYNALKGLSLTKNQELKLIAELGRLQMYNHHIECLTQDLLSRPLPGVILTIQSSINDSKVIP